MSAVLGLLYAVTAILHVAFFFVVRTVALATTLPYATPIAAVSATVLALAFYPRVQLLMHDRPVHRVRRWLEELYYIHWFALLLLPVTVPAGFAVEWLFDDRASDVGRVLAGAYLFGLAVAFWAVIIRRRWLRVVEHKVYLDDWPEALEGYRVAQLSDVHVGSLMPLSRVRRWSERAAELDVDLVALTGDYVTSGVKFHQDIADGFAPLTARDGVFAIMGNHDYFGDGEPLMSMLADRGIRVLRNEGVPVRRDEAEFLLVGVDDRYTKREDIDLSLESHRAGRPTLVLAHNPVTFDALADAEVDLVLSGHTHWGQVAFPFFPQLNVTRRHMKYHTGLYRKGRAQLYVHPGVGTSGPPVRLGTWPELTVISLHARKRFAA